jgi:hypothetical protein
MNILPLRCFSPEWFGQCEHANLQCINDANRVSDCVLDLPHCERDQHIDSAPLDSFGDRENANEDNELEEIKEDAIEESQSSRKKRTGNYTEIKRHLLGARMVRCVN